MGPNSNDKSPHKRQEGTETQKYGPVKMETEIGIKPKDPWSHGSWKTVKDSPLNL